MHFLPEKGHIFDIRTLCDLIFRYRVLITAILLFIYVVNDFNGSSIACWNRFVKQDSPVSKYAAPILGHPQPIRSDEWEVDVPRMMTSQYEEFGRTNSIVTGTETPNLAASHLYRDFSALARPSYWGYFFLDFSHGLSFQWGYMILVGFLISFEFFYLLTGKRYLGLLGGVLFWFSTYNPWWSFSIPLLGMAAIPVFFYYMLKAEKRLWRLVFALLLAIAGADFICFMYPAWQVPAGWILLAVLCSFFYSDKNRKKYSAVDWLLIAGAFCFMILVIIRYFWADTEYIEAVMSTAYPGKRVSCGANTICHLLGDQVMFWSGLSDVNVDGNNSVAGTFALIFPLAYVLYPLAVFRSGIFRRQQENHKNSEQLKEQGTLLVFLIFPLLLLTFYCTSGIPLFLAKATMMSYSLAIRAVNMLGALLVIVLMVSVSIILETGGLKREYVLILIGVEILPSALYGLMKLEGRMKLLIPVSAAISAALLFFLLFPCRDKVRKPTVILLAVVFAVSSLSISPLMKGMDAITDKEAAGVIRQLVEEEPDALWMSNDRIIAQYAICFGARTLNSTNYVPNKKMWVVLDPEGKYEDIWNRYAHVQLDLLEGEGRSEEVSVSLAQEDVIIIHLHKTDMDRLGVKYLITTSPLGAGTWSDGFSLAAHCGNLYIWSNDMYKN